MHVGGCLWPCGGVYASCVLTSATTWESVATTVVMLQAGLGRVKANLTSRVKKGGMTQKAADAALGRLHGTLDYSDFKSVDMVCSSCSSVLCTAALPQQPGRLPR